MHHLGNKAVSFICLNKFWCILVFNCLCCSTWVSFGMRLTIMSGPQRREERHCRGRVASICLAIMRKDITQTDR